MKVQDAIEKRRSIRAFKPKFVSLDKTIEIVDAATKVPLAGNVNTVQCIIVEEPKTIQAITAFTDQVWITKADKLIVVCSDEKKLIQLYDERAHSYAKQQVGAAIQNMLLRATELGVGTCWIGSYLTHEIKNILGIPEQVELEAIIAIGYANETPKSTRKPTVENLLNWEKWGQSKRPTNVKDPTTLEGKY